MATNNIATHPRDDAGAIFRNAVWEQLAKECQLQACEQRILEEARQAGLKHGISVPLFGPAGRLSMVSFASCFDDADPEGHVVRLKALAWHFHIAFAEIAKPSNSAAIAR
ncbi:autoinducer binding domain-containing protein [Bradyrhizobium sp. NC92]|uniref:autoinducer binding domain-containing protein n=1 Tax=Bradyrhizobium sp. (strain NC92) TaxID=55395 RepID=UPI00288C18EC|nr:autoinducer binding domain-containing protein [Bradyrhizobium sp. NC92]